MHSKITNAKRLIACLTTLSLCLGGWRTSEAQERECPEPQIYGKPGKWVTSVQAGCRAPFSGQLLEPAKALELGQRAEKAEKTLELTLTATRAFWAAQMALKDAEHEIDMAGTQEKNRLLEERVEAVRPSWYEHPIFVASVTVVAMIGLASGTAALLDAVTPE